MTSLSGIGLTKRYGNHEAVRSVDLEVQPSFSGASESLRAVGAVTVSRAATDKSVGLAVVARQLGLHASDFMAFGDAENDLSMFRWAGSSYCPANGSADAKAAATLCSSLSNDEDFIVQALREVGVGVAL